MKPKPFVIYPFFLVLCFVILNFELETLNCSAQHNNVQLWGMTSAGGKEDKGTLFHYIPSIATHTIDFSWTNAVPGQHPQYTELTDMGNGRFYGMASEGGDNNLGVIFEWDSTTNIYTKKFDFNNTDGTNPYGSLTLAGGKLYGMTPTGGANNIGVIFEWDPVTSTYTKKLDFDDTNGNSPYGSLTLFEGKLYGMTFLGGAGGNGVIFEWDPATNNYSIKQDFDWTNGGYPYGSLTLSGGKFYGMTSQGGANSLGVLFEWDPVNNIYLNKYDFDWRIPKNGHSPMGSLTFSGGKLYGVTSDGGTGNSGVIFEWDPGLNIYTKKIDFNSIAALGIAYPFASNLTLSEGKFYGMTYYGGDGSGVIYEWDPVANSCTAKFSGFNSVNGSFPNGSLTLAGGKLYGMTYQGGSNDQGVIFKWDPVTNIYTKKLDFGSDANGAAPRGSLTFYSGKFYGMTSNGGANNLGVIFEWDTATKVYTKKYEFNGLNVPSPFDGANPYGSLTLAGGKFYGMTYKGGAYDLGVIFEWDPATNSYTKKYDFNVMDGNSPYGSLTLSGGKFYGMTSAGGENSYGVIFEWDPIANSYTKKYDFDGTTGSYPRGNLTLLGGKFYGMAYQGGAYNLGVIFEWNPATNSYTKKYDFNSTNGTSPWGSLTFYSGKFYGMTSSGGGNNVGVIFEWNPTTNIYTKKIVFSSAKGTNPKGNLTFSEGKFYGMTNNGGANNFGVIFEWNPVTNTYTKKLDFNKTNGATPLYGQLIQIIDNQPPVLSNLPVTQNKCLGILTHTVTFTLTDADNDVQAFSGISSNTTLLPNLNISVSNVNGNNYQVIYTLADGQTGTTVVTINADDGYGGSASFTFSLVVNSLPAVTLPPFNSDTICTNGGAVLLAGGSPAGGAYSGNGVSGSSFDPALPGIGTHTITYTYSDINGCSDFVSQTIYVDVCAGIITEDNSISFNIYPNPFSTTATIQVTGAFDLMVTEIKIFDLFGQEVISQKIIHSDFTINRNNLPAGIYSYYIISREEILKNGKLIME